MGTGWLPDVLRTPGVKPALTEPASDERTDAPERAADAGNDLPMRRWSIRINPIRQPSRRNKSLGAGRT